MNEHLLKHAIDTVWCNPSMDRQFVYRPVQLTPRHGVHTAFSIDNRHYALPMPGHSFHVYRIGKVLPKNIGLPSVYNQWMSLEALANNVSLYCELYLENGIQFPRRDVHLLLTSSGNLHVAVRINQRVHSLEGVFVFIRFYSNAYFDSVRSSQSGRRWIKVVSGIPNNTQELVTIQRQMTDTLAEVGGIPLYFVNGRFSNTLTLMNCIPGDVMEMVIDSSIIGYHDFNLDTLPSFFSSLSNENKYILHYDDPTVNSIRYLDDLDVFIYKPVQNTEHFLGVTYHRNDVNWLRQLTHKDYSIPNQRLTTFVHNHPEDMRKLIDPKFNGDTWNSLAELKLRLYFRDSGYDRPLQPEVSRIHELYRLPSDKIIEAMTGINSTVPLWKAENLERSAYTQFMGANPDVVNPIGFNDPSVDNEAKREAQEFAGEVFGYHAAASILAKTPSKVYVKGNSTRADLAYTHWMNSTIYEFNHKGALLTRKRHNAGSYYEPSHIGCKLVEAIHGIGGNELATVYGTSEVTLDPNYNYRVYVIAVLGGVQQGPWIDITELPNSLDWGYLDKTGETPKWIWTCDPLKWYGAVRQDSKFLSYDLTLSKNNGLLKFSIVSMETHQGLKDERVLEIPFGQLDIFLNSRFLIEGLDYVVNWPEVVISNIEYLNDTDIQNIHVRGYGFCNADLTRQQNTEVGFIEYGVLSNNGIYNLHTHRVQRIVIDGHLHDPSDVHYDEDGSDLVIEGERNGAPYCIQTPPVVFSDVFEVDKEARDADDAREKAVSEYLTRTRPKRERPLPDTITTQYHVVSAFTNKIIHDLKSGILYPDGLIGHYSDMQIREWLKGYEWLLEFDINAIGYDEDHVSIWPHWYGSPVGLTVERLNFLRRVVKVYFTKAPDLTPFVFLDTGL